MAEFPAFLEIVAGTEAVETVQVERFYIFDVGASIGTQTEGDVDVVVHTDEALKNFHAPEWGTLLELARPRTNPANYIVVKQIREPLIASEMSVEEWTVFKMLGPS